MSRRCFLRTAAGTLGALGAGLLLPTPAWAAGRDPNPIPGGFADPFGGPFPIVHTNNPEGPADMPPPGGNDPSSITDFDGFIGATRLQGTGTGTDTTTGNTSSLLFDAHLRLLQGTYQSVDGRFLRRAVRVTLT